MIPETEPKPHFLTGEDYPHLCRICQSAISAIAMLYQEGEMPDTDDVESPLLCVTDNLLMCHGDHCEDSNSCYCTFVGTAEESLPEEVRQ